MSSFLCEDWQYKKLGDIFSLHSKSVIPNNFPDEVFDYYSLPAFDRIGTYEKVRGVEIESNKTQLTEPTILVSKLNPRKPRVMLTHEGDEQRQCSSTEFMAYKPKENKVNLSFYKWYLVSDLFHSRLQLVATGSTNSHVRVSPKETLNWRLPIPPILEQQKIAKILTSVDEVIEKTQAQIDKLKDLKTGMMQELLTNGIGHTEFKDSPVGRIPAEWEVKTVESVLSVIIDYRGKAPPKSEVGVPLITAKNIRNGFINQEPREYIFEEQFDSWMVRGMPKYGDVFITTEAPLGNVAKVPNYKFAIGQRVLTLRPNELICTEFLLFILQSEKFKKELDLQSTGSTVAGIKQSTFRKVLLPVPPIDEQIKISENLNSIVSRVDVIQNKLKHFKSLKKALMQDLLTGKVRVETE